MNSREAAFLALLSSLREERFISDYLDEWFLNDKPLPQDYHLAQQIAYGSAQMALALEYLVLQVSPQKKVHLKLKERALLRTALYQIYFLDRVPRYAIVDESMKIAKKYFHRYFVSYLNAVLRKLSETTIKLPQGSDLSSLSIHYSYPASYIANLISTYGKDAVLKILAAGNKPATTMARVRNAVETSQDWKVIIDNPVKIVAIPGNEVLKVAQSSDYYIQNVTPAYLIAKLAQQLKCIPERVLDMCASPGGKSIAIHDFFPKATLYANDVSPEKTQKLSENFEKYQIHASVSCQEGENLEFEHKFDLIILDVPCSNSGVLNKRPEARWRLNDEHYAQLRKIQSALLAKAVNLLKPEGTIWYMTCSILPQENEELVASACQQLNLEMKSSEKILSNAEGWDGGFACSLKKKI